MEIRKATTDDIDKGLLEVFIEGYRYHQNGRPDVFNIESDEELRKELVNNLDRCENIIAILDGKIVGHLAYRINERHGGVLYIDELVIKEEYRKHGIGRSLMEEAKKIALDNNCSRIEFNCWVFNDNALAVYDHMGFEKQRIFYEMKLK